MKKTIFIIAMLAIGINAQAQLTDTGGNVGIGTTTPAAKLHIQNSNATGTYNTYFSGNNLHFDRSGNGASYIDKTDLGNLILRFGLPVVNRFTFTNDGSLGIGTTTPVAKLHVNGDVYADMGEGFKLYGDKHYFGENLDGIIFQMEDINGTNGNTDGGFVFRGYTPTDQIFNDWMVIKTGGKVGIGTKTPNAKLHVNDGEILVKPASDNASGILKINEYRGGGLLDFSEVGDAGVLKVGYYGLTSDRVEINGGISNTGAEIIGYDDSIVKFQFKSNSSSFINGGNVGIGTTTPTTTLDVNGDVKFNKIGQDYTSIQLGGDSHDRIYSDNRTDKYYGGGMFFRVTADPALNTPYGYIDVMTMSDKGTVGIGTRDTKGFKLGVEGKVAATEVKIATYANWADFVFAKNYQLPSLEEVESHIKEKGHLQNIPSASEVKKEGFFLGEMDAKLLQKIEELTLYTIQQEKEIQQLKKQNKELLKLAKEIEVIKQKLK